MRQRHHGGDDLWKHPSGKEILGSRRRVFDDVVEPGSCAIEALHALGNAAHVPEVGQTGAVDLAFVCGRGDPLGQGDLVGVQCSVGHERERTGRRYPVSPNVRGVHSRDDVVGAAARDTRGVDGDRNVLGGPLEVCSMDPLTGFFRDGACSTGPQDAGSHTICAVVSAEFLEHQQGIGNDLSTPVPLYRFPGLKPGDRWCVTARNWVRAHEAGAAAWVVLAATHERVLDLVPLDVLKQYAVDVPADAGELGS